MRKKQHDQGQQKQLAREHIDSLFKEAEETFSENKALANRYVELARRVAMKVKVRIPAEYKRRFCKYCHKYLRPGVNTRIRMRKGKVIIYCLECKRLRRIPVK